tara:strand:- start:47 stop:301 length:255 start_codon:yes stop_codon:yes gene_type:complete
MRSKEVARLLSKYRSSLKVWEHDYWLSTAIKHLESNDFSFDDVKPLEKAYLPHIEEEDLPTTDTKEVEQEPLVVSFSTGNWLTF